MKRNCLILIAFLTAIAFTATADELYLVTIDSPEAAAKLRGSGAEPIVRTTGGYIVLAGKQATETFSASGLAVRHLASGVSREAISLDQSLGDSVAAPVLFREGDLRLLQSAADARQRTAPLPENPLKIEYVQPGIQHQPGLPMRDLAVDLDSLIGLVVQDTLYNYVSTLQAFPGRVCGSAGNYQARDWIVSKFTEYGYDSVYTDNFMTNYYNVVATKIGSRFPDHQIVVGGHFDAVSGSPGADDNGSGTSGVLELARILADIETDMTFVFVTFDAEEIGLYGSYDYVDKAMANGDNIVYMFNMDMIGAINNVSDVTVYHGTDLTYSNTYNWLADSLLGLNGVLSGNIAASDHYPFTQQGIPATFLIEYNFSPVYHTYQDSTTWMDFTYMTKLVKSAIATTYYVSQTEGPVPSLQFSYPEGLPMTVDPGVTNAFQVQIDGIYDGVLVISSPALHYNVDDHGWQQSSLNDLGGGLYEATLPAADCGATIEFYVTAEEEVSGQFADPDPSEPNWALVATETITVLADDFETDLGWTVSGYVTDGAWDRGVPVGGGDRGDPPTDYDGSGQCYLTDNAPDNSDVDGGTTSLTSPIIDCSGGDVLITYARWYHNSFGGAPFEDSMMVYLSNDGGMQWFVAEVVGPVEYASGGWYTHSFWLSEVLPPTDQVRLRFNASDQGSGSVVEAGVDAVEILRFECTEPYVCGDADGSGVGPDIADLVYLVSYMFSEGPPPPNMGAVDVNGDGAGPDIADLVYVVSYMFSSGPELNCP